MPKIIADLQEKILDTALRLFTTEAYNAVDMRRIAEDTGIATGTLYNYFSSKRELLLAVLKRNWQESLRRLEDEIAQAPQTTDRVTLLLRLLYQEFRRNRSLTMIQVQLVMSEQIKHTGKPAGPIPPEPMQTHLKTMTALLHKAVCQHYACQHHPLTEDDLRRLVEVLPLLLDLTDIAHGDVPEENLQFLSDLVHGYIRTQIEKKDFTEVNMS